MEPNAIEHPRSPEVAGDFVNLISAREVINYFSKPVTSLENLLNWCIINEFQDNGSADFSVDLKNYISSKQELTEIKDALFKKGYRFSSKTERFIMEDGKVTVCDLHFNIPFDSE